MNKRQPTIITAGLIAVVTVFLPWAHSPFVLIEQIVLGLGQGCGQITLGAGVILLAVGCFWSSYRVGRWVALAMLVILAACFGLEYYAIVATTVRTDGAMNYTYVVDVGLYGVLVAVGVGLRGVYCASRAATAQTGSTSSKRDVMTMERQGAVIAAGVVAVAAVLLPWAHSLFVIVAGALVVAVGCFWSSQRVGRWVALITLVSLAGYFSVSFYVYTLGVIAFESWSWGYFIQAWLVGSIIGLMLVGVKGVYVASQPTPEQTFIQSLERSL